MSLWSAAPVAPAARRAERLDQLACGIALALILLVAVDFLPPARLVLALLFTCFVPGRAVVTNWPRVDRWAGVGMSVAFSLGLLTLLATISLWLHFWNPLVLFVVEAVISLAGLANGIVSRRQLEVARLQSRQRRRAQPAIDRPPPPADRPAAPPDRPAGPPRGPRPGEATRIDAPVRNETRLDIPRLDNPRLDNPTRLDNRRIDDATRLDHPRAMNPRPGADPRRQRPR